MKSKFVLITLCVLVTFQLLAQPKVYINFVSHNEPGDNLQTAMNYLNMKAKVLQLASIIDTKGASWNLETCDGFVLGAWNNEPTPVLNNVFKTLTTAPYADNIEIDPRTKTTDTLMYNIADTWHYLDTMGCNPTHTVGGFLYSTQNASVQAIDWWKFEDTITALSFPWVKWKAHMMWGAGSYTPHSNDLNDYGIWKPSAVSYTATLDSFYRHNPNNSVWYIGNGCQPLQALDTTESIYDILNPLRDFLDSIQSGDLPQDNFYVYSITINQSSFGPTLFQQISTICDTINSWDTTRIQWKRLTDKFTLFEQWQTTSGAEYSQWNCGQTPSAGLNEWEKEEECILFPNPTDGLVHIDLGAPKQAFKLTVRDLTGKIIQEYPEQTAKTIDIRIDGPPSIYFVSIRTGSDEEHVKRVVKW